MFRQTSPTHAPKTRSGSKGTPQINRLKNQLKIEKKKLTARQNAKSHAAAFEKAKTNTTEGYKVQPLGSNHNNSAKPIGKGAKLNNSFFMAQQQELDQKGGKAGTKKRQYSKGGPKQSQFHIFNNSPNAQDGKYQDDEGPDGQREEEVAEEPMTTQQQQAQKVGGVDTRKHVRSMWYMTPVDGISDQPTAQGRLPHEYQPTKFFIPDPMSNPYLSKLAAHPKVRIKTTAFEHLSKDEQDRALKSLDLPHPDTLHKSEPFPHLHYFSSPLLKDRSPFRTMRLTGAESRAFRSPKLAVTAFSINQVPRLRHHTRDVEIVFVGRSNVGKSSLINSLTHSDLAKTGRTPGKTQSLNFYALHPEALRGHRASAAALSRASQIDTDRIYGFVSKLDPALTLPLTKTQETTINACYKRAGNGPVMMLVDVPGYGHANAPDWIVDKWNVMLGSYLRLRSPLNFPTDEESKWTIKEFKDEMTKLRKNRAEPRRKKDLGASKKQTNNGDEYDEMLDDGDDGDEASDAWESDFEQDPLKLFETALNTHVDQMQYHLEKRVADYQTLMGKFNELEELQRGLEAQELEIAQGKRTSKNPLYDPVAIQEKRLALLQMHTDLRNEISNDPLNSTVTNLPQEWDEDGHNKLRESKRQSRGEDEEAAEPSAAMNRYKRLASRKTQTLEEKNVVDIEGEVVEKDADVADDATTTPAVTPAQPAKRPLLRIKPRIVSKTATTTDDVQHSTTTQNTRDTDQVDQTTPPLKPTNTTLKTDFTDDLKQIQDEIDGVLNEPVDPNQPIAPRRTRLMAKRGGVAQKLPTAMKRAKKEIAGQGSDDYDSYDDEYSDEQDDDNENVHPVELMKTYRKLQLLETQLNTHTKNNLQPLQTRLPPLEHLGKLNGSPLKNVVVLLDARAGVTKYDLQFLNFLEKFRITHQVVLTKIDRMSSSELEGSAYSVAQALFPHEYVKLLQKTQPLSLAAFPEGKMPKGSPTFTVKSNEQDKLWEASVKYAPRKYLSPLLIGVSSEKRINVDILQRSLLHGIFERI